MCLIIARKAGMPSIPAKYITNAAYNNPDGFGIVGRTTDGKVYLDKTLDMNLAEKLIRNYEDEDMDFAVHFRWATHGDINEENTHPYQLRGLNYLMHNGIVDVPCPNKSFSDTWHLAEQLKSYLAADAVSRDNAVAFLSRPDILKGSKYVIVGEDIPLTIINKNAGIFENQLWYSNSGGFAKSYYGTNSGSSGVWEKDSFGTWKEIPFKTHGMSDTGDWLNTEATIDDLAHLSYVELLSIVKDYPEEVAEMIMDAPWIYDRS